MAGERYDQDQEGGTESSHPRSLEGETSRGKCPRSPAGTPLGARERSTRVPRKTACQSTPTRGSSPRRADSLRLERADVARPAPRQAPLIGCRGWTGSLDGVDRRASSQKGVRLGEPAVVAQGAESRVDGLQRLRAT